MLQHYTLKRSACGMFQRHSYNSKNYWMFRINWSSWRYF